VIQPRRNTITKQKTTQSDPTGTTWFQDRAKRLTNQHGKFHLVQENLTPPFQPLRGVVSTTRSSPKNNHCTTHKVIQQAPTVVPGTQGKVDQTENSSIWHKGIHHHPRRSRLVEGLPPDPAPNNTTAQRTTQSDPTSPHGSSGLQTQVKRLTNHE
jgi:hypothetical protein